MKSRIRMRWCLPVVAALMLTGCLDDGGGVRSGPVGDTTAPQVSSMTPSTNATGVSVNSAVSVTFSEAMAPGTITAAGFRLEKTGPGPTTAIPGAVNYLGTTATFTPAATLDFAGTYTATLTTAAQDLAGNALAANLVWTFTTGTAPDTIPPQVLNTTPASGAIGIAINSAVSATFSEALQAGTVTTASFTLDQAGTPVAGAVGYSGATATFTPNAALAYSTLYTVTLTTAIRDLAANALAANSVWTFTTGPAPDSMAPTVTGVTPSDGATNVNPNSTVAATFSETMNGATLTTSSVTLTGPGGPVAGTVGYSGLTATFSPTSALNATSAYTMTITTSALDVAGNGLAANYSWNFTPTSSLLMTVDGGLCLSGPTLRPGCTFNVGSGTRVTVSQDANYNSQGFGSDDMWYVQFDNSGRASVYNDLGVFQYFANPIDFAGYISGSTIGVGNTGLYWVNVAGRQYWFGATGILYDANTGAANYAMAIN